MDRQQFNKSVYDGSNGQLMLEMSKTYKGDQRFKLDHRFKDDIDLNQLPQKLKRVSQTELLTRSNITKQIKKNHQPLIIRRYQPGTKKGIQIVKQAQGLQHHLQSIRNHQNKKNNKHKLKLQQGINRAKKAETIIHQTIHPNQSNPSFKIIVNGDRKQAFKPSSFKLFD